MRCPGVMGAIPRYAPVLDAHFVYGGEDVLRTSRPDGRAR